MDQSNLDLKKQALIDARTAFETFIQLYPDTIFTEQAKTNLENLPAVE
jgi:outer membrane protein assembly factor BamD (BamD/ComL family)